MITICSEKAVGEVQTILFNFSFLLCTFLVVGQTIYYKNKIWKN
jgi:hypothetical protein